MPDGYRIPPHFHPADEHVEVKQGTFLVGMGDKLDLEKTRPLAVGDTGTAPAGMHHFSAALEFLGNSSILHPEGAQK
jgi:quercetin dioxygenase-like cupin family protein